MENIKAEIKKRGTIKAKLTNCAKVLSELASSESITQNNLIQIKARLSYIEQAKNDFEEIQDVIEMTVEDTDLPKQYEERFKFENEYFNLQAVAKKLISENDDNSSVDSQHSHHSRSSGGSRRSHQSLRNQESGEDLNLRHIKLPTINLPKFNGTYHNWLEFRDTFRSLIHDNNSISSVQKFHYLKASLEADAALVIKSLEISSSNYIVAWDALLERYDNNKLLIHNHVKALFNSELVIKESAADLRKLIDHFSKNLRALEQLQQPVAEWDTLLVYVISTKLDNVSLREWEQFKADSEIPKFNDIKAFLKSRADMLEMLAQNQIEKRKPSNINTRGFLSTEPSNYQRQCIICQGEHYVQNCKDFLKLSIFDRDKRARSLRLCLNCLKKGHHSTICRRGACSKCNEKHHSLLHQEQRAFLEAEYSDANIQGNDVPPTENTCPNEKSVTLSACVSVNHVFLSTAYVQVLDLDGKTHTARALLDSGAQSSFITKELCERLKLKTDMVNISVKGLNNISSNISAKCQIAIQSLYNSYSASRCVFVIDNISGNIPVANINVSNLKIPKFINLADPTFFKSTRIDILLGSDLFWDLLSVGQISLGPNNPILQKTKFGWIVSGPISLNTNSVICNFVQNVAESDIQKALLKFWEIEEAPSKPPPSKEEIICERHFIDSTRRDSDGRFIVSFPFKDSPCKLGDSLETAKKRFISLEHKFKANPEFKRLYDDFIEEYVSLNHAKRVQNPDNEEMHYYMPHHGVQKSDKLTSQLRVVFDASSPTTSGFSLNNLQHVGPTLQENLFSILLRFRKHKYVICGDIAKMYRQVLITPEQQRFQRIIWRKGPHEPFDTYELRTVTYGQAAASFLAIRCLFQLADENSEKYPKVSNIIKTDFYVDDLLSGADDLEEAAQICAEITAILQQGGFELRKFYSNYKEVLKYVDNSDSELNIIDFGENENAKTLGITWSPTTDKLLYKISIDCKITRASKRSILSSIGQIFDPLGLLSPYTIMAKILIQRLWLEKVSWDETIPMTLLNYWRDLIDELPVLNNISVNRRVICDDATTIEMHAFADASEDAYGCCIYIRSRSKDGHIFSNLLCSKSKVSPLKTITLPRLELMAALVAARLAKHVRDAWKVTFDRCIYWSDSTIVLGWLKHPPHLLKTFISNRVSEIQELTISDSWRHVPSKSNPADLVSRGVKPKLLISNPIWWNGPSFLCQEEANWPQSCTSKENLPDIRKPKEYSFAAYSTEQEFFKRYSDVGKLKRVTAYILRFYDNCIASVNSRPLPKTGCLTKSEVDQAMNCLIKISQVEYFQSDINNLKQGKPLNSSKIIGLNPFIDSDNILRVGGRINNSQFPFEKKHPAILHSNSHLAQLLTHYTHIRLLHAGPQHTLATIREEYWIVGGRILVKNIVRRCIPCFRFKPKSIQPIMASLPGMRLNSRQPFELAGVDYAGPITIKSKTGRSCSLSKAYICLFICCVTKAVHMELVTDLSKESFLLSLKRFMSRRGRPVCIYSDNGTNFLAAHNELQELGRFIVRHDNELTNYFQKNDINWKFIPPYSPHFGGLWESGIKSMKHHLRRVTKDLILTYEGLYTILVEVEGILNSRPLSPISTSPHDFTPLTPSHFLIGRPLTSMPERDVTHLPVNRLSLYQHLTQVKQHLWARWSKEYISELQQRTKWKKSCSSLKLGSLVLIKEEHQPLMKWKLGRVEALHKGNDGLARVATIKTEGGTIKRSFSKICPLPIDECEDGEKKQTID